MIMPMMDEWYEVYIDRLLVQFERKLTGQRKGLKKTQTPFQSHPRDSPVSNENETPKLTRMPDAPKYF